MPETTEQLPDDLPEPVDDGTADHLAGSTVPSIVLTSTDNEEIDLSMMSSRTVVYAYPMSGPDNTGLPDNWDSIPGARGCSPQHCSLRDHHEDLQALGVDVYGLATQPVDYLRSEVGRLHLPYPLLSDDDLVFADAVGLPRFDVQAAGRVVLKRTTLIISGGVVEHVFYPVFPPHQSAQQVMEWLRE